MEGAAIITHHKWEIIVVQCVTKLERKEQGMEWKFKTEPWTKILLGNRKLVPMKCIMQEAYHNT